MAAGVVGGSGDWQMQVMRNNITALLVVRASPLVIQNCATRSRSIIAQLAAGDELRVVVPTTGQYYAGTLIRTQSFTGFLLQQ